MIAEDYYVALQNDGLELDQIVDLYFRAIDDEKKTVEMFKHAKKLALGKIEAAMKKDGVVEIQEKGWYAKWTKPTVKMVLDTAAWTKFADQTPIVQKILDSMEKLETRLLEFQEDFMEEKTSEPEFRVARKSGK